MRRSASGHLPSAVAGSGTSAVIGVGPSRGGELAVAITGVLLRVANPGVGVALDCTNGCIGSGSVRLRLLGRLVIAVDSGGLCVRPSVCVFYLTGSHDEHGPLIGADGRDGPSYSRSVDSRSRPLDSARTALRYGLRSLLRGSVSGWPARETATPLRVEPNLFDHASMKNQYDQSR